MLDEARALLQAAETETDPERKLASLEEALDLLDEVKDTVIAGNLRRSYTRRLITQLFKLKKTDILTWFDYARFLLLRLEADVEAVLKDNPDLKVPYEEFMALWRLDPRKLL